MTDAGRLARLARELAEASNAALDELESAHEALEQAGIDA